MELSTHHWVPAIIILFIVILYLIIAFQFKGLIKSHWNREAKRALLYLIWIFVLCAASWYLPAIVPVPHIIALISHIALILVSIVYIITNQARHIANALK